MARTKSVREQRDEDLAEQEALARSRRSQSGVKFPATPTVREMLSTGYKPPVYGEPEPPLGPTGPRRTPGQMGTALGQMMGEFLAGLPENTPLAKSAAATLGSKVDGLGHIVAEETSAQLAEINRVRVAAGKAPLRPMAEILGELEQRRPADQAADRNSLPTADRAIAMADTPAVIGAEVQRRSAAFTASRLRNEAGTTAGTALDELDALTKGVTAQQGRRSATYGEALDGEALDTELPRVTNPNSIVDDGTGYIVKDHTSVAAANAGLELKRTLEGNRPKGVQELADLITKSRTATNTAGKFPSELRAESYETALRINALQTEKIKTMNPADFQNYGDAFQHAQLNGMNPSEALKFASDWSKIAPQGQQSSSQAAPRSAGTPQTNEQFRDSLHASNKRAAEVAQAVRDGIKARQAPPSATAPSGNPGAAPSGSAPMPTRERKRVLDEQAIEAGKVKAQAANISLGRESLALLKDKGAIVMESMPAALMEYQATQSDWSQEKYDALTPAQRAKFLHNITTAWMAKNSQSGS